MGGVGTKGEGMEFGGLYWILKLLYLLSLFSMFAVVSFFGLLSS